MVALKAQWVVRAGLIPGDEMSEYTKAWSYTSVDFKEDGNARGERFSKMDMEAERYGAALRFGGLNWVNVEYMWM